MKRPKGISSKLFDGQRLSRSDLANHPKRLASRRIDDFSAVVKWTPREATANDAGGPPDDNDTRERYGPVLWEGHVKIVRGTAGQRFWVSFVETSCGLERVAEELMGRRKWRQLGTIGTWDDLDTACPADGPADPKGSPRPNGPQDFEPQQECCFCDAPLVPSTGLSDWHKPLAAAHLTTKNHNKNRFVTNHGTLPCSPEH
ncbi:hypothetical protein FOCC_FOCC002278 [Frankliniella occidentalis]|nr:hypothetical protein FOCC_FOCC002278 [Frankliniella occidentalis]